VRLLWVAREGLDGLDEHWSIGELELLEALEPLAGFHIFKEVLVVLSLGMCPFSLANCMPMI
jgi:hypothetical protein